MRTSPQQPVAGVWKVSSDLLDLSPDQLDRMAGLLRQAAAEGKEFVVSEGITLRWSPIEVETLSDERARIAAALRRYFEDGPSTFRGLLDYLDLDYSTAYAEGWMDFNNAIVGHDEMVAKGERKP